MNLLTTWSWVTPFANHLWQSTLFAAIAALLTLALRKNHAHARYWLWLTASLKFLLPFSLLVRIGSYLTPSRTAPAQTLSYVVLQVGQPFPANGLGTVSSHHGSSAILSASALAFWILGCTAVLLY